MAPGGGLVKPAPGSLPHSSPWACRAWAAPLTHLFCLALSCPRLPALLGPVPVRRGCSVNIGEVFVGHPPHRTRRKPLKVTPGIQSGKMDPSPGRQRRRDFLPEEPTPPPCSLLSQWPEGAGRANTALCLKARPEGRSCAEDPCHKGGQ